MQREILLLIWQFSRGFLIQIQRFPRAFAIAMPLTGLLVPAIGHAERFHHFLVGGGVASSEVRVRDLPVSMEKRTDGYSFGAGYYFYPWFGLEYRSGFQEDIDFILDDYTGDFDLKKNDISANFSHFLGESRFFVRGRLGLADWDADGYLNGADLLELDNSELRASDWDFDLDGTELEFRSSGISPFIGLGFGYDIRNRVEFLFGYEYLNTDLFELQSATFVVNVRL